MFIQWRVAVWVACFSLFSEIAYCHTRLVSSTPVHGQVLTQAPDHILVRFSSPIEKKLSQLQLSDDNGKSWRTLKTTQSAQSRISGPSQVPEKKSGPPASRGQSVSDRIMIASVPALQPARYPARFKVRWRVLSKDGHTQQGELSFELRLADQID
jgi:methionine-rich copper-binding protein CopC